MYKYRWNNAQLKKFSKTFLNESTKYQFNFKALIIIISLISILLIGIIFLCSSNWFDINSQSGSWNGKSEEQIIADLNAQVGEGEMNISIANTVKFANGSTNEGIAHIENIAANNVDQKVKITLENDDEILYQSGAIAPNHCINTIKLNKVLDPGLYKAIATFTAYDIESHKEKGSIVAQINLLIE